MERQYRSWLPAGVADRSDLDDRLAETLAEWSAKWFVRRVGKPLAAFRRDAPRQIEAVDPVEIRTLGDDLALVLAPSARRALACAMIGVPDRTEIETTADHELIDALSQTCLDDLCRRLAIMTGLDAAEAWNTLPNDTGAGWTCDIGLGAGAALLRLTIGEDAMIGYVRRTMAPAASSAPLGSIGAALRKQPVHVSARLGGCAIPLADFSALGVGDVLVLDRAATSAIDLAIDGHPVRGAPCTVVHGDGSISLSLQHSLDR